MNIAMEQTEVRTHDADQICHCNVTPAALTFQEKCRNMSMVSSRTSMEMPSFVATTVSILAGLTCLLCSLKLSLIRSVTAVLYISTVKS